MSVRKRIIVSFFATSLLHLTPPKVMGLEVLGKLRAKPLSRALPVTVLSSSMNGEDVRAACGLGCNSYIAKGIDFSLFTEAAECLLQYWLVLNVA
jgi:two-component system, response regulator